MAQPEVHTETKLLVNLSLLNEWLSTQRIRNIVQSMSSSSSFLVGPITYCLNEELNSCTTLQSRVILMGKKFHNLSSKGEIQPCIHSMSAYWRLKLCIGFMLVLCTRVNFTPRLHITTFPGKLIVFIPKAKVISLSTCKSKLGQWGPSYHSIVVKSLISLGIISPS